MSNTITIRLPEELIARLKEKSRRTGIPVGRLIRDRLESETEGGEPAFMKHVGAIKGGPRDVSSRKGFSPK